MKHILIVILLSLLACKEDEPAPQGQQTNKGCMTGVRSGNRELIKCSTYTEFVAGNNVSKGGTSTWDLYTSHQWEKCSQCQ